MIVLILNYPDSNQFKFSIQDIDIIFYLNFNRDNFPFGICILTLNINENVKVFISEVIHIAPLILFCPQTNINMTLLNFSILVLPT